MKKRIIRDLDHAVAPAGSGVSTLNPGVVIIVIAITINVL